MMPRGFHSLIYVRQSDRFVVALHSHNNFLSRRGHAVTELQSVLLKELDVNTPIEKLIAHSLDVALYQVSVQVQGVEYRVKKNSDAFISFRNPIDIQRAFRQFKCQSMVIRHQSAYDEMVGQPVRSQSNALEVPFGLNTLF